MKRVPPHSAPRVAAQEGETASADLLKRSGWRWVGALGLAALVAGGVAQLSALDAEVTLTIGASLVVVTLLLGPWLGSSAAISRAVLLILAVGEGLAVGALDLAAWGTTAANAAPSWLGLGKVGLAAVLCAEVLAQLLRQLGRPRLVTPVSLFVPVVVASLAAYLAPASWVSALGCGLATLVATLGIAAARLGEQAAPARHGPDQLDQAAATRALEVSRTVWLWILPDPYAEDAYAQVPVAPRTSRQKTSAPSRRGG